MTANKVRTDYEQLTQTAQAFGQQAEAVQQMLGVLQKDMNALQGGDWVGKGADAFYAEMNGSVLPAMGEGFRVAPGIHWTVLSRTAVEPPDQ